MHTTTSFGLVLAALAWFVPLPATALSAVVGGPPTATVKGPVTLSAGDCAGCLKRQNGEDAEGNPVPWTKSYTFGSGNTCTVSFRERYTSYNHNCNGVGSEACTLRECSFTWKLQVKDSGGVACNGNTVCIEETVPPASKKSVTTTSSWRSIISDVTASDVLCGYETQRAGIINEGETTEESYDFTIGCQDCLGGDPPQ